MNLITQGLGAAFLVPVPVIDAEVLLLPVPISDVEYVSRLLPVVPQEVEYV